MVENQKPTILVKWLRTLVVYSLIFLVVSFVANIWLTRDQASGPAPQLQGMDLDNNWTQVDYTEYDQPLVLYFFAEWCPICKVQHPVISSIDEGYPVVAIAMQSGNNQQVSKYLQQQGLSLQVINDVDSSISRQFGVQGVPASFVVNNTGEIAFSTRGYMTELGLLSRIWLAQWE